MPIRFRCSKCQALMQVADQAAGQRTQCPSCKEICQVPHSSTDAEPKKPAAADPSKPRPVSPGSSLTSQMPAAGASQSVPARPAGTSNPPTGPRQGAAPSPGSSSAPGSIIQIRCSSCQQLMRAAAGAMVRCPHCSTLLRAPGGSGSPASSPASSTPRQATTTPASTPFPSSSSFGGSSAFPQGSAFPQQSIPTPSYQQPQYQTPSSFGGGYAANPYSPASGGSYRAPSASDNGWQYMTLGVVFTIFGSVILIYLIFNIIMTLITLMTQPNVPQEAWLGLGMMIGGGLLITLPVALIYIFGGISLIRRTGLNTAKTVAVTACIPCFNCLILEPFGIWAAILVFSDQAKKDFE